MQSLLHSLFGLILALVLLIFVFVGKWLGLLGLILAPGLLVIVFEEKAKKILLWLATTLLRGLTGLILALVLVFIVLNVWDAWRIYAHVPEGKPMFTSTSPNKRFTVAAYPSPTIFPRFAMPGQGSDGPALFILRDNLTGKEMQRQHVGSLWYVYTTVDWCKDSVKLARGDGIEWRLPQQSSSFSK